MSTNKPNISIYVCTTNSADLPKTRPFIPIQGGASIHPRLSSIQGDDTGDNISSLNPLFCEMTAMYWAWKNAPKADYIGLFHYRRFLNFGKPLPKAHWMKTNFFDFSEESMQRFGWDEETIAQQISDADIVMPTIEYVERPPTWDRPGTLYTHYRNSHVSRDINLAIAIMKEINPEDSELIDDVMQSYKGYFCHMFIMKWEIFHRYMDWLFEVTRRFTDEIDIESPLYRDDPQQRRVSGFIGERIINVFVEKMRREGKVVKEFQRLYGILDNQKVYKVGAVKQKTKRFVIKKTDEALVLKAFNKKISISLV